MATKVAPTEAAVKAWAATSTRPNGDCQGFAGNDATAKFGTFAKAYSSANAALAAAESEGHFHKGVVPPSDGRVYWVYFKFPTYGHVMLFINGICIGDTSHAKAWLNKKHTVGTMTIAEYPYAYLGYSTSNGLNTIPAPIKAPIFKSPLTEAEIKKFAAYLNGLGLGKTTTANVTGLVQSPGESTSNYYWLVQEDAIKKKLTTATKPTGIPTAATYALEQKLYNAFVAPPKAPVPPVTPPVVVAAPALTLTEAQVETLDTAYSIIGKLLNK